MQGFYTREELIELGFCEIGENVLISKKASIYGASKMKIGNNVRIDDFCILVGNIILKNNIHIAAYTGLHASMGSITMDDFSTLSSQVSIYAASDDYSGKYMTNSVVPQKYKNTLFGDVYIGRHVIVGVGTSILQNAYLPEGVAIGAMSLVKGELEPWGIYAGVPCKRIKEREKEILELEKRFLKEIG